jgi:hypothetical protein
VGAGIGIAVLLVGCGGGGARLDARDYVRETSAVCARANRAIARVRTGNPMRESVRVIEIHRRTVRSLRDLRPPKASQETANLWIGLVDQALDELDEMRAALRARRFARAADYARAAAVLAARARDVAREHHITPCRVPSFKVS